MSKDKTDSEKPEALNPESDLPPDADIEERFNDFWKNNAASIFGGIAIGAVAVVGIQLFDFLGEKKEASIRETFAAASTTEARVQFVEANPDHQLAGLAQLQIADTRYAEGLYSEAAELYGAAANVFADPTLASRARLGQGVSLLQLGTVDSGRALLEAIALDGSALDQTRGEAAYHLAVSYWESGNSEKALEATDIVLQLDAAPFWVYRANALRERLGADAIVSVDS